MIKLDLSGDIDGLKQIGVAIWELCKAMAAVVATSWLTMVYQGISAIMLFNDPIKVAVDELKKTATLVKGFADITIPENVPSNLQALSTSLGAVAKAMWSLESVGVSVLAGSVLTLNGYLGTLSQNLTIAKKELTESAKQINSMSDLDTIDEGVASKLEAVTSSLANVGKAMGALSDVNWDINMGNIVNPEEHLEQSQAIWKMLKMKSSKQHQLLINSVVCLILTNLQVRNLKKFQMELKMLLIH